MLNKYPLWKYLLVLSALLLGLFYAAPNLYAPDPALQIAGQSSSQQIDDKTLRRALNALDEAGIAYFGQTIDVNGRQALLRLEDADQQLVAQARVSRALGDGFIVALNLAPTTPDWLSDYGGQPMKLGLDLSGGVHFKRMLTQRQSAVWSTSSMIPSGRCERIVFVGLSGSILRGN
jgi:preprotein translocase subunit SecD